MTLHSPTAALLWEIWRRKQGFVWAIAGFTAGSWVIDMIDGAGIAASRHVEPTLLNQMLGMLSFLFLFTVFSYTESGGGDGTGGFPRRLFTLPVSSLRLVAVPVLTGIASVELLYVLWMDRLSRGESTSALFVGVLLAAFMVCSQAALWTLARLGGLRLVVLGAIAFGLFAVGLLPTFPSSNPSPWRSEVVLMCTTAGLTVVAFLLAWRHVASLRTGGRRDGPFLAPLLARVADAMPRRRTRFTSPMAAHFWYEWRCGGLALPGLVGGVLLTVIGPSSWLARNDPRDTMQLLLVALASPIALALPMGMAFARPSLSSEDLSLPAFVAIRPLSADDLIAIKARVAATSVAIAWFAVLVFTGLWLSSWANRDAVRGLADRIWAAHHGSAYAVAASTALALIAAMLLTWRCMVGRMWSTLRGSKVLSALTYVPPILAATASAVFDFNWLPRWILDDPARLVPAIWLAALAVTAKYGLAVYAWRRVDPRYLPQYLPIWLAGTACFVTIGVLLLRAIRLPPALDTVRVPGLLILLALLIMPLARLGLAPSALERNRHRA